MQALEKKEINIGYIPLLDCIAILWAEKQGYFSNEGLKVHLHPEASWASLRDRLAYGFLDSAHCLSAMLPATALGQDQLNVQLQTPLVLSVNQAFISLRQDLCHHFGICSDDDEYTTSNKVTQALKQQNALKFAYVYKYSIHHFCLKEWLALSDMHAAQHTHMQTSPPPLMVKGLIQRVFDGFCVSEPWNVNAQIEGHSLIVATSSKIIPAVADKVLAVTQEWAQQHPKTLQALMNAIQKAQHDLKHLDDLSEVWALLRAYKIIQFECSAEKHVHAYHKIQHILRNAVSDDATPQAADFVWMIEQMQKWENLQISDVDKAEIAQQCIVATPTISPA